MKIDVMAAIRHMLTCFLLLASCALPLAAWAIDTDGDGVDDSIDAFPNNIEATTDTDGDGAPDVIDYSKAPVVFSDSFSSATLAAWSSQFIGLSTTNYHSAPQSASFSSSAGWPPGSPMLSKTLSVPDDGGQLHFWSTISSVLVVDGVKQMTLPFNPNVWTEHSLFLTPGNHTILWDGGYGYLDDVELRASSLILDKFPLNAAATIDADGDGVPDSWNVTCDAMCQIGSGLVLDNCPMNTNHDQADDDHDGFGNPCDSDGPGKLDSSFATGSGANSSLYHMVMQSDGKIVIAGHFTAFNGVLVNDIVRLNADGSLDNSFNADIGADSDVFAIAIQSDGKIVIVGGSSEINGAGINGIARLNADGSLDGSFNPGSSTNYPPSVVVVQPDGKILIGGYFNSFNGAVVNGIARLNADGSLDKTFKVKVEGVNGNYVLSVAVQLDGKILIGGVFDSINNIARSKIARLNTDGSLDSSFNPGSIEHSTSYSSVNKVTLQPDGKIFIYGYFTSFNGTARNYIASLNADGSLDGRFNPDTDLYSGVVSSVLVQADGKIVIGGSFKQLKGSARNIALNRIARLNADGSLDTSFNPGTGASEAVGSMLLQANGKIVTAGSFQSYNGTQVNYIARIHTGDADQDGIEDAADNCPSVAGTSQTDADGDGIGDFCDPTPDFADKDNDGDGDAVDNCPAVANASQIDIDGDGIGDFCDLTPNFADKDNDAIADAIDNCPLFSNANQRNADGDFQGDACDVFPNDPTFILQQEGAAKGEQFGSSIAMADINSDGVVDMLVGSPMADVPNSNNLLKKAGKIQIISGKDNSTLHTINGFAANQQFGTAIAVVADQNSDGVPDIIVGEPLADVIANQSGKNRKLKDAGRVALYSGRNGAILSVLAEGNVAGDHFGAAVAVADVNSDAQVDLIVGAPRADVISKDAGQVTVFNGLSNAILYQRNGAQAGENFGAAVAIDNTHLFVGSPLHDVADIKNAGSVSVFNSSEGGSVVLLTVDGAAAGDAFGSAVAAANNDWAVGIPLADSVGKDAGAVQIFSGMNTLAVKTLIGVTARADNFGCALSMQGDVDNDGKNDLAIGAEKFDAWIVLKRRYGFLKDVGRVEVLSGAAL